MIHFRNISSDWYADTGVTMFGCNKKSLGGLLVLMSILVSTGLVVACECVSTPMSIDVEVVQVTSSATKTTSDVDWEAVFNKLRPVGNKKEGSLGGGAVERNITESGTLSSAIIPLDLLNPEKVEGTNLLLKSLESQGSAFVKYRSTFTAYPHQPSAIAITDEYTGEHGVVVTGFTMTVNPVILKENDITLELSMTDSILQGFETVSTGAYSLQIPEIQKQVFRQRVNLKKSHTTVVTAYEYLKEGDNGMQNNVTVLLMITPRIIEGS